MPTRTIGHIRRLGLETTHSRSQQAYCHYNTTGQVSFQTFYSTSQTDSQTYRGHHHVPQPAPLSKSVHPNSHLSNNHCNIDITPGSPSGPGMPLPLPSAQCPVPRPSDPSSQVRLIRYDRGGDKGCHPSTSSLFAGCEMGGKPALSGANSMPSLAGELVPAFRFRNTSRLAPTEDKRSFELAGAKR